MTFQKLMNVTRKGIEDFNMIKPSDKIAVGISGGKDSLSLLWALSGIKEYHPAGFSLCAVTVDLGFEENDFSEIENFAKKLGIEYKVVKTNIGNIIFEARKEKNPCALCSKMKRAVLCNTARELGCNTLALAHHRDDVVETFFMNLMYSGKIDTFRPVTYLEKTGIKVIRPFIYVEEKDLVYFSNKNPMPVTSSNCPADKNTKRQSVKELINNLAKENRDIKSKVFGAILRDGVFDNPEKQM